MAQEEVARWVEILSGVGVDTTAEQLVDHTLTVSQAAVKARATIVRPFRAVSGLYGGGQAWGLFTYADPYPGRLVIEGTRGGNAWFPLYRAPQHDGSVLARTVHHRRVRGVWDDAGDRPKPGKLYRRFVTWLSGRIFEEYPDITEVRVRLDQITVRLPGEPRARGPEKPRHVQERSR